MEPLMKYGKLTKKNALQIISVATTSESSHLLVSGALLNAKMGVLKA